MPGLNQKGPDNQGPMTGRAQGNCPENASIDDNYCNTRRKGTGRGRRANGIGRCQGGTGRGQGGRGRCQGGK